MESKGTTAGKPTTESKRQPIKPKGNRGLGKAGAKRLGQLLRKAIQEREGAQGNKKLPKTTVGLLKHHQADVMAKVLSGDKRKLVPRVSDLILQVIAQCKKQGGITMVELKKALTAGGYDVGKNNTRVNRAVKGLVRTETLLRTPGTAVSYKFNSKTMKLTADKKGKTRAARKRETDQTVEKCPKRRPAAGETATIRSTETLTTRSTKTNNKLTGKTVPTQKQKAKGQIITRQAKQKGGKSNAKAISGKGKQR